MTPRPDPRQGSETAPDLGPDLKASVNGAVGKLTLNRPDKLNPLGVEVLEGIEAAVRWFDSLRGLKVIVVSGEGRSFCAGADIAGFVGAAEDDRTTRERADAGRRMGDALEAATAVTVARIHGHCIGGGVVLASACDFRVAASDTYFSIPEVDLGIPLAWGGVPRLIREIGAPAARDLVMTCRPFDAAEAARLGLVQRVVEPEDLDRAVEELVEQLSAKASFPLLSTKAHVNAVTAQMTGTTRSWADADGLVTALSDPESRESANRYLANLTERP